MLENLRSLIYTEVSLGYTWIKTKSPPYQLLNETLLALNPCFMKKIFSLQKFTDQVLLLKISFAASGSEHQKPELGLDLHQLNY